MSHRRALLGLLTLCLANTSFAAPATDSAAAPPATAPATAPSVTPVLDSLDQRLKALEAQAALKPAVPAPAVPVTAGPGGFSFASADGQFVFKPSGYVQFDGRFFSPPAVRPTVSTFLVRRARPVVDVTVFKDVAGKIMPDFGDGKAILYDAWVEYRPSTFAKIKAGKYKPPVGLEQLMNDTSLPFLERGLPTSLTQGRDVGIQLSGDALSGRIAYAAGVFNGAADAANTDTDTESDKDGAARIFLKPCKTMDSAWLKDLGFGVGGSWGHRAGTTASPELPSFKTVAQQTWFSFKSTALARGHEGRLAPQASWYANQIGLIGEYTWTEEYGAVSATAPTIRLHEQAWQAVATVVLTGEKASPNGVIPDKPVESGGIGAIELAGRVNELGTDPRAFPALADPTASARTARGWAAGVNWYLNANLKWVVDYEQTRFAGGGSTTGDRKTESVVLTRFQLSF